MEIDALFRKYTAAFDALDADAITSLYRLPCAISDSDGVQTYTKYPALLAKFQANCEAMKNFGYQHAKCNILTTQELSPTEVVVNIGWRTVTTSANIDFRSLYICHRIDDTWLIFSANVHPGSFA